MIRTQIQLTDEQFRQVKRVAAAEAKSIAQIIREALDARFAAGSREDLWKQAWEFVGCGEDYEGATDVAIRHDHYLARAYGGDMGPEEQASEVAEPRLRRR